MSTEMTKEELDSKFNQEYEKAKAQYCKKPNILVCGYTGSGKTSLTKTILGDVVPAEAVGEGRPKTMDYCHYENDVVSIWDSQGLELGETEVAFMEKTREFIKSRVTDMDVDKHIHLVWYTIQGPGARVTDCDLALIKEIFPTKDLIVVITKSDITRPSQKEALKRVLMENGVSEDRIVFTSDEEGESIGCKELVDLSLEMLPEAYRDAFAFAQNINRERKKQAVLEKAGKAKAIIVAATTAAGAAGAVPIPLSDAAVITPIQVTMIASLAALYGLNGKEITVAAMPFIARAVGTMTASSLLKLIPGLGSVVNASVAILLTGAMGWFVQTQFEKLAIAKALGEPPPDVKFNFDLFRSFLDNYKAKNDRG